MKINKQLNDIRNQLEQNMTAFKKIKQNYNTTNLNTTIRDTDDLKKTQDVLQSNLKSMRKLKQTSSDAYESVIKHLKLLLQSVITKNEFLIHDRGQVLKQNYLMQKNVENLTLQLDQAKNKILELKLNGYSGKHVNGTLQNGNIFDYFLQPNSRLITQKQHYSIQSGQSGQQLSNNQEQITGSPSQSSSQQESLLICQQSQQMIKVSDRNQILSPAPLSQLSSDLNHTPNYNFKENAFEIQNFEKVQGHYLDMRSGFISYENSHSRSGGFNESNGRKYDPRNQERQVEISMNNINNELYLPINQNKKIIKQEIETFKEHLRKIPNVENIHSQSGRMSHGSRLQKLQPKSQTQHLSYMSCASQCQEGIFRSFYLSILQFQEYREKYFQMLQQLQHDQSFILFNLYPKNVLWIQLIGHFLDEIEQKKLTSDKLLEHINTHPLLDILMVQSLKYRVQFLFNECQADPQLQESSLLNNSNNRGLNTYRQSVNASFHNVAQSQEQSQTNKQFLSIFLALSNTFGLECRKFEKCFQFYESDVMLQNQGNSRVVEEQPLFRILNQDQTNVFVFACNLQYGKSNHSESRGFNGSEQRHEYQNSVKKQFQYIQLNEPSSQQPRNQQSEGQRCSQSSQQQGSFISQTNLNQYEDQSFDMCYKPNKYQEGQNAGYQIYDTNENTMRSVNLSKLVGSYEGENCKQLRQKNMNYNILSDIDYPIQEELIQTESKKILQTSFGKSKNVSKFSSVIQSKETSNQVSRVRNIKEKPRLEDISAQDCILRKVRSVESSQEQQSFEVQKNNKWQFNNLIR